MSFHLILTAGKDARFTLIQTPSEVTTAIVKKTDLEPKATLKAYLEWYDDTYLADLYEEHYTVVTKKVACLEHKCALLEWILEHPDHQWDAW